MTAITSIYMMGLQILSGRLSKFSRTQPNKVIHLLIHLLRIYQKVRQNQFSLAD
jgi:hypothetical protein